MTARKSLLTTEPRRWHWRTWNLLLQIRDATDGNAPWQRSGEGTGRGLCVAAGRPEMRAFRRRKWVRSVGAEEVELEGSGNIVVQPAWVITERGRKAIAEAKALGTEMS